MSVVGPAQLRVRTSRGYSTPISGARRQGCRQARRLHQAWARGPLRCRGYWALGRPRCRGLGTTTEDGGRRNDQSQCWGCSGWSCAALTAVGWAVGRQAGAAEGKKADPASTRAPGPRWGLPSGSVSVQPPWARPSPSYSGAWCGAVPRLQVALRRGSPQRLPQGTPSNPVPAQPPCVRPSPPHLCT